MTAGSWAIGLICLAGMWLAPYAGARRLVRRLVPAAPPAPALLASVVVTLTLITLVSELLGSLGQFRRGPMAVAGLLTGALAAGLGRPRTMRFARQGLNVATVTAAGLAVAVAGRWAIGSASSFRSGVFTEDSIQYHLPFAATFAQSGWLSRLHYAWLDPVWTFYPYGSEIFHAMGMAALGRDVLSPLLNLGWLAIALLAAWCCGARWEAGPVTLAVAGVVFALPMLTESQPGSANSDAACLALLLAAVALLFTVADTGGGYLLVGLAAGLAAGTTLYALPPVVGLAAGLLLFDRRPVPRKLSLGFLGLVAAGGYWYLRNLIVLGNPVPGFKLGPLHLPAPPFPIVARYGYPVAHYLPDAWFWKDYLRPGLHTAFGTGWPIVAALAITGVVAAFTKLAPSLLRPVLFASAVAALVYIVTPTSAYGPRNAPFLFAANLRFLLPSVAWLVVLGGVFLSGYWPRPLGHRLQGTGSRQAVWVAALAVLGLLTLAYPSGTDRQWGDHPMAALAGAVAAVAVLASVLVVRPAVRATGYAALAVVVVAAGLPLAERYSAHRYTNAGPIYSWARSVRGASIGTVAFAEQYPLFGLTLGNRVSYVGSRGAHGSIVTARTCAQWRQQLAEGHYDFVVIGENDWTSAPIPQLAWTESDPAARAVLVSAKGAPGPAGTVFRLGPGSGTSAGC